MQLGYSTWGMPGVPIDTAIRQLAQLGFDGLELTVIPGYATELSTLDSATRRRIVSLLKTHRLLLPAIAAHSNLLDADPEGHARTMQRLKGAVDLAVDLAPHGMLPVVATTAGGKTAEWAERKALLVERLGDLVAYARARGVVIAIEPHVDSVLDTPARVLEVLALIDSPHLKVNFDISHFDVLGMPIAETVAALAPYSVHTHVKDQRGRYPDFEFLIPGEGQFDYVAYLQAMHAHGYAGFITAEVSVMVQRRPGYDPLAAAAQSYAVLARAFAAAGIMRG
jgi:inosose dehydratase